MMLLRFACLICLLTANIKASTHWMVTESGLIQSKEESQFVMARPSDLLSFLNQEIRWHNTFAMYDDLIIKQRIINSLWNELEEQSCISKHIVENEYCNAAGDLQNFKWHTVFVEDGKSFGISEHEFKLYAIEEFGENDIPDCKKISSLTFSMTAFEHLEAMINRAQLNATAEKEFPAVFTPLRTVDEYGHWLSETLRRNTTSWLHYNLASIYWRLKGNVPKALECSRRAVHYAPRMYKTVPLLCMGSILLRSDMTDDAVVVLGAAVDHSPSYSLGHFTLAEAYASAGEFNSSIKHFNISINLDRNFEQAMKYRNAVLCHVDMLNSMHNTQRTLKKLSAEMREFRNVESQWYQTHSSFLYTMKHEREYQYKNVDKNCLKMEEISNLNIKELRKDRDRNSLIEYLVNNPQYSEQWERKRGITALFDAFDLEKAVKRTAKKTGPPNKNLDAVETKKVTTFLKEIGPKPSLPEIFVEKNIKENTQMGGEIKAEIKIPINLQDISIGEHLELSNLKKVDPEKLMYPPNMQISRNRQDFDIDPEWPPTQFCIDNQLDIPDTVDSVHPVFLPFEHKGISVNSLLSDKIGVPALMEHELPWHPPLCPTDKEFNIYSNKKPLFKVQLVSEAIAAAHLKSILLMYVSTEHYDTIKNMQDAEIGQRIHTAIQKKLASKWVLFTLASLYWRVRGNTQNALNCLLTAKRTADTRYKDVVLVSLGSVFLDMGLWEDALIAAEEAFRMGPYEPPTNFLLAQLHLVRKQPKAQYFHMKQVLRVEPQYMAGYARSLFNAWACLHKQFNEIEETEGSERLFCSETEPGVNMMCRYDGTNCRVAGRDQACSKETGGGARMYEVKKDTIKERKVKGALPWYVLKPTFDNYIEAMPTERSDMIGHEKNFETMIESFTGRVGTCPENDCAYGAEALNLRIEECTYDLFQVDYWLMHVCYPQELNDVDLHMMTEMATMPPSHRKVPECKIPYKEDEDFFVARILSIDTDNWSPLLTVMQHFNGLYSQFDFVNMGARLASYVEANPRSWVGATMSSWWCGAEGRASCTARCAAAAHALAPRDLAHTTLRHLVAALHMQSKAADAMEIAYLAFYTAPRGSVDALILGLTHYYRGNVNEALWMYRYALAYDSHYVPAMTCLHIAMCERAFGANLRKSHQTST